MASSWKENRTCHLSARCVLFLMFGVPAVMCCSDDPVFLAILIAGGVGVTLTLCMPTLFYLRWQRKKQSLITAESHAAADPAPALSRGRVYALMAAVTLMSAIYQAYRLDEADRPLGHSRASVFLWNFGILFVCRRTDRSA